MKHGLNAVNNRLVRAIIAVVVIAAIALISVGAFGLSWQRVFSLFGFYADRTEGVSVSFIDVGKADCSLITCGESVALIDAGEDAQADKVVPYLERYGIEKIDVFVATHPDKDHIGGAAAVIERFEVKRCLQPSISTDILPDTSEYKKMTELLNSKNIFCDYAEAGDKFSVGELKFSALSPAFQYDTVNNNSVVLRLDCFGKSFLFTGDAEEAVENNLADIYGEGLKSDVLKVSHHGSKNATSNRFLQYVSPQYGVISVGENTNNLPSRVCVDRLNGNGVTVYRTDLQGTVTINVSKSGELTVHTEK